MGSSIDFSLLARCAYIRSGSVSFAVSSFAPTHKSHLPSAPIRVRFFYIAHPDTIAYTYGMPTLFTINGFRFFFYSNEMHEPCHIHIIGRGGEAKFWIPECALAYSYRLSAKDLKDILLILKSKTTEIKEKWDEYFKLGL